jgi:hypothetical protein
MFTVSYFKRQIVRNIASPYSAALLSYAGFLCAWTFPPQTYISYVHEPDLLFFNFLAFTYFTACLIAFILGVRSVQSFQSTQPSPTEPGRWVSHPMIYLMLPLALATLFCGVYLWEVGAHIDVIELLSAQQAQSIKLAQVSGQIDTGKASYALPLLIGTVWWAAYRVWLFNLKGMDKWAFRALFGCAIALGVAAFGSTADRGHLIAYVAGANVVCLYHQSLKKNTTVGKLLFRSATSVLSIVIIFVVFTALRGAGTAGAVIESSIAYTIASYNRMSALLSGQMTYMYHGTGVYLAPYLLDRHKLNSILPIAQSMGWPSFVDLWRSEFMSVAASGLNPSFIWSGAFGYLYSDLGWGAIGYLYIMGIVIGCTWARFRAGGTVALTVYPYMLVWILLWFGTNNLFDHALVGLVECAMGLLAWDLFWLHNSHWPAETSKAMTALSAITRRS